MISIDSVRHTTDDKAAASIRLLLAAIVLMTGVMKLVVPMLAEAWSGQLLAANIPVYSLSRWSVPFVEMAVGAVLAVGFFARVASAVVIGIMVVATLFTWWWTIPHSSPSSRASQSSRW